MRPFVPSSWKNGLSRSSSPFMLNVRTCPAALSETRRLRSSSSAVAGRPAAASIPARTPVPAKTVRPEKLCLHRPSYPLACGFTAMRQKVEKYFVGRKREGGPAIGVRRDWPTRPPG